MELMREKMIKMNILPPSSRARAIDGWYGSIYDNVTIYKDI